MDVPHIIHQVWIQGKNHIPKKFVPNMEKIKKLHPSWKYCLWDDLEIISLLRKYPDWLDIYYKLDYLHQKVDYVKYIILYLYGGIYIDMDMEIKKPLDELLQEFSGYHLIVSRLNLNQLECILISGQKITINNGIIISVPKEEILNKIIEYIGKNFSCFLHLTKFSCINSTTGPKMFTNIVLKNLHSKVKILEPEYLEPTIFGTGNITSNTYVVHYNEVSWLNGFSKNFGRLYIQNRTLFLVILLVVIGVIIWFVFFKNF